MTKKLQIFVSSTYLDLKEERQAAVQAILEAGHIPAGMELFAAGNESQWETIKEWIDDSDIYMLILGGRYGSIEPKSGKSYIQLEFEYALEKSKPIFSVVMSDTFLNNKVKNSGASVLETESSNLYKKFKATVSERLYERFDEVKDIKLAVLKSLPQLLKKYNPPGWVSGKDVPDTNESLERIISLQKENEKLRKELDLVNSSSDKKTNKYNGKSFGEVCDLLSNISVSMNTVVSKALKNKEIESNCLDFFYIFRNELTQGMIKGQNVISVFVVDSVVPALIRFGLVEQIPRTGLNYLYRTSGIGNDFLVELEIQMNKKTKK